MEVAALGLRVDGVDNTDRASSSLGRLADSAKNAETASGQLDRASKSSSKSISEVTRESDRASRSMRALASAIKPVAASLAAAFSVRALTQYADTWSDMTSLVRVNIGAHEDAAEVMGRLADIARSTYSSLELTAQGFAQNAFTLNALGKTTKEQLDYTAALNNALVVSGAKGQQAQMVQDSLNRAMAEGSLRGQELQNVLNYGSTVATLLAKELGVNVTQLREVAKEGRITADVIFNALVKNMEQLEKTAESMPATVGDAFLLLRNSVLQAVGVFDQANGISEKFAERLVKIADAIREVDLEPVIAAATVLASVIGARLASSALASAAAFSAAQIEAIRYQAALASMAGVSRTTAVGLTAMSAAARTATAAMALVGGPAGAIMLAAGALVYFATRTREAEDAQKQYNEALGASDRFVETAKTGSNDMAEAYRKEAQAALDASRKTYELQRARLLAAQADIKAELNRASPEYLAASGDQYGEGVVRGSSQQMAKSLEYVNAQLAEVDERLAKIAEREAEVAKVGQMAVAEVAGGEWVPPPEVLEQFRKLEASLERQLALYGQTSEVAKLRYEMEHGSLRGLTEAQQKRLEDLAKELDAKARQDEMEELRKKTEQRLQLIRDSLSSEYDMEVANYERKREWLATVNAEFFESEVERKLLLEELEAQHQSRLFDIQMQGQSSLLSQHLSFLKQMEAAEKASGARQLGIYTNAFAQITAAGAQHSKALFEINKVAGISNAVISTYQGAAKALELGWPMGPIAAAAITASGMAQVAAISSTQYGAKTAPSVGATPALPVTPIETPGLSQPSAPARRIYVEFEGSDDRKVTLREFREQIRRIKEENPDAELVF